MPKKEILPYAVKQIKMQFKGKAKTIQFSFKGKFTKKQIMNFAQKQSNTLFKEGKKGSILITPRFDLGMHGWRSGADTAFGSPVDFYTKFDSDVIQNEPDSFSEFRMYLLLD